MARALDEVMTSLDTYLKIRDFGDYCPNGLQVANSGQVNRVCTAVTASLEAIEMAAERDADLLLVHHGYFWKGEPEILNGMKYERIKALLQHDIALAAYHLPLDAHPEVGNNAEVARLLEVPMSVCGGPNGLVATGELSQALSLSQLAERAEAIFGRVPLVIPGGDHAISRLAWCTGAAQDWIIEAKTMGADAYLSGEVSERTYYQARELGIHYLGCGHHATERFGIRALGEWLQQKHPGLSVAHLDSKNPI